MTRVVPDRTWQATVTLPNGQQFTTRVHGATPDEAAEYKRREWPGSTVRVDSEVRV